MVPHSVRRGRRQGLAFSKSKARECSGDSVRKVSGENWGFPLLARGPVAPQLSGEWRSQGHGSDQQRLLPAPIALSRHSPESLSVVQLGPVTTSSPFPACGFQ